MWRQSREDGNVERIAFESVECTYGRFAVGTSQDVPSTYVQLLVTPYYHPMGSIVSFRLRRVTWGVCRIEESQINILDLLRCEQIETGLC